MTGRIISNCSAVFPNDMISSRQVSFVFLVPSCPKTAIWVGVIIFLVVGSTVCVLHWMVSVLLPSNFSWPFRTVLRSQSVRRLDHRRKDTVPEHAQNRVRRESLAKTVPLLLFSRKCCQRRPSFHVLSCPPVSATIDA